LKDIIVVGASGFGLDIAQHVKDAVERRPDLRLKGFLDDDPRKGTAASAALGVDVLGDTAAYFVRESDRFVIAVGLPDLRRRLTEELRSRGAVFETIIHPTAYVASTAVLGAGCLVAPFATVGSSARIGEQVLVNLYACAGHNTTIGSYSVLSPYAIANGGCVVAEQVFLGTHAAIMPEKTVGAGSRLAAGAIAYLDVPALSLATGNPARAFPLGPGDR